MVKSEREVDGESKGGKGSLNEVFHASEKSTLHYEEAWRGIVIESKGKYCCHRFCLNPVPNSGV